MLETIAQKPLRKNHCAKTIYRNHIFEGFAVWFRLILSILWRHNSLQRSFSNASEWYRVGLGFGLGLPSGVPSGGINTAVEAINTVVEVINTTQHA